MGKNNKEGKSQSFYKNKNWEKELKQRQIRKFVENMLNYSLPITNTKETSGKSILGAYANVAFDNFDKTLQYIYKKVGLRVNGTNQVAVLEKILDAYRKEKEWYRSHPNEKKPGKKSQYLLTSEQNEKMKTLLFHHFSVLAPILGSMKNAEIAKIHNEIKKDEENKSLTEEKSAEIIKKVKDVVTSAHIDSCLKVLVNLSKSLHYCRNLHSHYRAYNNRENQINMFKNFALTAGYLTNALKASAIICQTNAGNKAKQYEFITGEYHYTKDKKEYSNYYYRIKGKRNTIKASDKIEPDQYDAISDYGLIYLTSLFLSKSDTELMLDQLEVFKNSPFKDEFTMEKAVLTSIMAVYRINIPKGKRMKMEDDNVQLCLDMLNELQKCPQELYDVISQKGKDSFKREQTEPVKDPITGEYVREIFVKSEKGQAGQQKVRSNDGTGNIVYQGKGVYSLLVRKEDRFPYFALRYIDNQNLFPTIRFHIDLGYYRFAFYPKHRIDGSDETRILQKRINGFGKLVNTDNAREERWEEIFQESEIRKPNETKDAVIAKDEEGNIIEIEQLIKADSDTKPFVTDKRANYNIHNNRIGLYWKVDDCNSSDTEEGSSPFIPELSTKVNGEGKVRPDVNIITPLASLSVRDLPALIFYEYLREDNDKMSAEKIIKEKYKQYRQFFSGIKEGKIKTWADVRKLEKKDIPHKFWTYLDGKTAGEQNDRIIDIYTGKDVENGADKYHFPGHIQERIVFLEREIKKFNDICLKMATSENEYGTDEYKAFRPASLARKMVLSVMEWLPAECPAKKIITGVNYGVMCAVLSQFGSDGKEISFLKDMFINGGIIASEGSDGEKSCYHPFLDSVLNSSKKNMENLYIAYITRELEYIQTLRTELDAATDRRAFIQAKLPFAKLERKRFDNRDESYYQKLAQRYLTIDNSENGGSKDSPAIILLPDGLFTQYIFNLLQKKYPEIFTGNSGEGANNNASYLISTYFEKVCKDASQIFYQCFTDRKKKKEDSRYYRHYKFFDYYDDPKLLKENYPGDSNNRKKKAPVFESSLSPMIINDKTKTIDKESILSKVEEYILLEEAKQESYRKDVSYNQSRLRDTLNRSEKQWLVHSKTKNKDFLVKKEEETVRLQNKLKKLDQMILNSQQKIERIKETYAEKFTSLKNECIHTEKAIRRYRIEDIVTYLMVSAFFKDIFSDKPEEAQFRLQDVGSKKFEESSGDNEAFLDKTVSFSRIIPVTFTRDESDMFKKNWEKDETIEKVTLNCEVFLNRIAIRNYNLALAELNDERLFTFLSHYAYIRYLYGAKLGETIRINYNRLSQEFKMYNQLRPDIFREVHAIERIIVNRNTYVLNNDKHRDFYIPMKESDIGKIKKGEKVLRKDEEAKRNSFVNLLALVFDEHNKLSISTKNIRNSAAHNNYRLIFKELADEQLLFKMMRAYEMPDKLPHELRQFNKEVDLSKKDPHSFAALILERIKAIREIVEEELK